MNFHDQRGIVLPGGCAAVQVVEDRIYVVLSLRNGKVGFWQIAYRDSQADDYDATHEAIERGELMADILYGDYEGGRRLVSRFAVLRDDDGEWRISTVRHVQIDRADPRLHG